MFCLRLKVQWNEITSGDEVAWQHGARGTLGTSCVCGDQVAVALQPHLGSNLIQNH